MAKTIKWLQIGIDIGLSMFALLKTRITTKDVEKNIEKIYTTDGKSSTTNHTTTNQEKECNIGVGIAANKNLQTSLTPMSDRVCVSRCDNTGVNRDIAMINSYASRLPNNEKRPELRGELFDELNSIE